MKPKRARVAEGRISRRASTNSGQIKTKAPKPVNHPSLHWRDLPQLFAELAAAGNEKAKALQFIILTGARSGEVLGGYDKGPATWAEIKERSGEELVWQVSAERMKAGEEHEVPLTSAMLSLLGPRGAPNAPLFKITQNPVYEFLKSFARSIRSKTSRLQFTVSVRPSKRGAATMPFATTFLNSVWPTKSAIRSSNWCPQHLSRSSPRSHGEMVGFLQITKHALKGADRKVANTCLRPSPADDDRMVHTANGSGLYIAEHANS